MTSLDEKAVEHLATLARLKFFSRRTETIRGDLEQILA